MSEFRVVQGDPLDVKARRIRAIMWGIDILVVVVIVALFILRAIGSLGEGPAMIVGPLTLFVLCFSYIIGIRDLSHYGERDMVFVLTDEAIERRWKGHSDRHIMFSEIESVSEELSWLIVRRAQPQVKIAIPKAVQGYDVLRAEIEKRCPSYAAVKFPWKSVAFLVISTVSWAAVFWLPEVKGVIVSGAVALITLAIGSSHIWKLQHRRSKRGLLVISLGVTWMAAFLIIYFRIVRP